MANRKVTKQQVDRVIDDASYLQKEAEALTYVIDEVPHAAKPPEGYSIVQLLMLIDHAQQNYYKPVIDKVVGSSRSISLNDFKHFKKTFAPDKQKNSEIQNILHNLANHRGSIVSKLNDISLINWQSIIKKDNTEILLLNFVEEMNHYDHVHLKKITNLVQAYHQEKKTQREIKQRGDQQNSQNKEE